MWSCEGDRVGVREADSTIHRVKSFPKQASKRTNVCGNQSSLREREKRKNKSAAFPKDIIRCRESGRMFSLNYYILLLHSIKTDPTSEPGSCFDSFLLK